MPDRNRASAMLPTLLLGTSVFVWGTSYWPTQVAAPHTTVLTFAFLRIVPCVPLFLLALPLTRSRLPRGSVARWTLLTGPLMIALFQWGVTEAVARAGPGNAAVLVNTPPLWVLVLGWIFLRERMSIVGVSGLLIGFGGVLLMVWSQLGGARDTTRFVTGMLLALGAALGWAIGTLLLKWLAQRAPNFDMFGYNALRFITAGVLIAAIWLALDRTHGTDWGNGRFLAATVWVGPIGAIGTLCFLLALMRLSATRTSSVSFLVPAVAVLVEVIRGRTPSALTFVGMALAVVGVGLVNTPPGRLRVGVSAIRARRA